jgi:2-polyprenyl-6-methoxyphenol hydroxylase-like FAD-dependent oxidoreductase
MNNDEPPDAEPTQVDLLVAGIGPGGAAAAIAARRLGLNTLAVEARGPQATRSQLILIRPGARIALRQIGFADITEGRRTTTIRHVENRLRAALAEPASGASAPFAYHWHTSVVGLAIQSTRVLAILRDETSGALRQVAARHLIDATGGRLEALGRPPRVRVGPSHWVITAEYAVAPWFEGIVGARDPSTHDLVLLFPTWGRRGVIAYLDSLPGAAADGEQLAQRFEALASNLGLGQPLYPTWAVDVFQRAVRQASPDSVMPIGDAVGTVDVLTGNGMSTAIEDAVHAVQAACAAQRASSPDVASVLTRTANAQVLARHRRAIRGGRLILAFRPILERAFRSTTFAQISRAQVGPPPLLWPAIRFVFGKRPSAAG